MTVRISKAYQTERQSLLAFIRSRIADPDDAEDILQDVFASTLDALNVTRPIDNLVGWLYTTARNKIIDWYRKKRIPIVSLDQSNLGDRPLAEVLGDVQLNPEHVFFRHQIIEQLTASLDELPPNQRDVFIWNEIEGRTFREIAELTGESINTLLSRKRYAVQFLRKRLEEIKDIITQMQ